MSSSPLEVKKALSRLDNLLLKLNLEMKERIEERLTKTSFLKKQNPEIAKKVLDVFMEVFDELMIELSKKVTDIMVFLVEDYIELNKALNRQINELRGKINSSSMGKQVEEKEEKELGEILKEKNKFIYELLSRKTPFKILNLVAERPLCIAEISLEMGLDPGTVKKHVNFLEREGYIRKDRNFKPYKVVFVKAPWS